jgi:hypothetical protein
MAKGDKDAVNSAINAEQPRMNQQRQDYGTQLQGDINNSRTKGQEAWNGAIGNYNQASQGFSNMASGGSFSPMSSGFINQDLDSMKNAEALFNQFIGTGGYSDADTRNMRARAIAPTTSIYANAQEELGRNRALQGGYSPNYGAASAKMAREMSNQIGQANIANEANIAEARNKNQLSGAQGLTQLGLGKASARTSAESLAENSRQFGAQQQQYGNQGLLNVGNGMTNLYGTGNADLNTQLGMLGNNISGQQAGNLGLIGARIQAAGVASNNQNAMANAGSLMNMASQGSNMMNGMQGNQQNQQYNPYDSRNYNTEPQNPYGNYGNLGQGNYDPYADPFGYTDPSFGGYDPSADPFGYMWNSPPESSFGRDSSSVPVDEYGRQMGQPTSYDPNIYSNFGPQGSQGPVGVPQEIAYDPTQDPEYWQGGQR